MKNNGFFFTLEPQWLGSSCYDVFGEKCPKQIRFIEIGCRRLCRKIKNKLATSESQNFREYNVGDTIIARDYRPTSTEKWLYGKIISREGRLMYKIDIGNNQVWRRHVDQLRKSEINDELSRRESSHVSLSPTIISDTPETTAEKFVSNWQS